MFAGLFLSHGLSFVLNFIVGGEKDQATIKELMAAPYGRIVVLHIAIIAGGFGTMALGQPVILLVRLAVLKLGMDITLHLRAHARYRADVTQQQGNES